MSDTPTTLNPFAGQVPEKPRDPVKVVVNHREEHGQSPENELVKQAARRMCPDGMVHVATFAVHIYKRPLSMDLVFISQQCEDCEDRDKVRALSSAEANNAIQALAIKVAKTFGITPNKRTRSTIIER